MTLTRAITQERETNNEGRITPEQQRERANKTCLLRIPHMHRTTEQNRWNQEKERIIKREEERTTRKRKREKTERIVQSAEQRVHGQDHDNMRIIQPKVSSYCQ